jgi:hypothetical protein
MRSTGDTGSTDLPKGIRAARQTHDSNLALRLEEEMGKSAYPSAHQSPSAHPSLVLLSGLLGREAAAFSRRHRYAGLGRLQRLRSHFIQNSDEGDLCRASLEGTTHVNNL